MRTATIVTSLLIALGWVASIGEEAAPRAVADHAPCSGAVLQYTICMIDEECTLLLGFKCIKPQNA